MTGILQELARVSAGWMLNAASGGLAIVVFSWVLLRVMGRRNSSTRFAIWFVALLAIPLLPLLSAVVSGDNAVSVGTRAPAITVPASWALNLFLMWAAVASLGLLRVALGLVQLSKLRAGVRRVAVASLDPSLRALFHEGQPARPVALAVSDSLRVPTAIGFFKPLIILPAWTLEELSSGELRAILIHELAHLQRWDDWTNLAQKVLRALLFFHPAVWWVEKQISLEREMACDDVVLSQIADPKAYAECLVSVAERTLLQRGLALAQAAVSRVGQTSLRVAQILDGNRSTGTNIWKPALGLVAVVFGVSVAGLSRAPELVAFEDNSGAISIASLAAPRPVPVTLNYSGTIAVSPVSPTKTRLRTSSTPRPVLARRPDRSVSQPSTLDAALAPLPLIAATPQLASYDESKTAGAALKTVVVVMQTQQYDSRGAAFWTISVWHLTVLAPSQTSIHAGARAKAI